MSTPTSDVADPIFTVAQMRAAEQALIDAKEPGGETVATLMQRAGSGAAEWVWRLAARRPVTVLCGPGNNGGDGYVIARELARRGAEVTVVAPLEPRTEAAAAARAAYAGPVADGAACWSTACSAAASRGRSSPRTRPCWWSSRGTTVCASRSTCQAAWTAIAGCRSTRACLRSTSRSRSARGSSLTG
jgi:hypothetical protein